LRYKIILSLIKAEKMLSELEYFENMIGEKLKASPVIHCDETGISDMGILSEFKGIAIHDGWKIL
jgi:transposase